MRESTVNQRMFQRLGALPGPVLWVIAARLKTLSLSLVPVAVGSWAAAQAGGMRLSVAVAAMAAAALIQIGTNLWNDAADGSADGAVGADGAGRLGPARMTGLGLLEAGKVRRGAGLAFGGATLLGLWLSMVGGPVIIAIGLVSLALGYFYSMGPRPLSHTPLGEVLVVLFFGVVAVAGTVFLHGQAISGAVVGLGVITGLPAAAVLLLNNHRDRAQDQISGRRTLAILLGERGARGLYALLLGVAWLAATWWSRGCGMGGVLLLPAAALGASLSVAMIRIPVSARLNRLIAGTAGFQVLLLAGLMLAGGICT